MSAIRNGKLHAGRQKAVYEWPAKLHKIDNSTLNSMSGRIGDNARTEDSSAWVRPQTVVRDRSM
jgi:hypothetical protein